MKINSYVFTALFLSLASLPVNVFSALPEGIYIDEWMNEEFCAKDSKGHGMSCSDNPVFQCNKYNDEFPHYRSLFNDMNRYLRIACEEDYTSIFSHINGIAAFSDHVVMVDCEIGYIHPAGVYYAGMRCIPAPNYSKTEHEQCVQKGCKFQQFEDTGSATYKCECPEQSNSGTKITPSTTSTPSTPAQKPTATTSKAAAAPTKKVEKPVVAQEDKQTTTTNDQNTVTQPEQNSEIIDPLAAPTVSAAPAVSADDVKIKTTPGKPLTKAELEKRQREIKKESDAFDKEDEKQTKATNCSKKNGRWDGVTCWCGARVQSLEDNADRCPSNDEEREALKQKRQNAKLTPSRASATGQRTPVATQSGYTSQKPFIEDGIIKQQFIIYKTLTGEDKTANETEFSEWKAACKTFEGKDNLVTVKFDTSINPETEEYRWYHCVANTCTTGYKPSGEWPVCSKNTSSTVATDDPTATQSGYTSQKPFIKPDSNYIEPFLLDTTLTGDDKTTNETEFSEWKNTCKTFEGKDNLVTVKFEEDDPDDGWIMYHCVANTCEDGYRPLGEVPACAKNTSSTVATDDPTATQSGYTSQKPFIKDDSNYIEPFLLNTTLTGDDKTTNETEFSEWKNTCKTFEGKDHLITVKFDEDDPDDGWILYHCVADTCEDGYRPLGEVPACAEGSQTNTTNATENNNFKDAVTAISEAFDAVVAKIKQTCESDAGKEFKNGECVAKQK